MKNTNEQTIFIYNSKLEFVTTFKSVKSIGRKKLIKSLKLNQDTIIEILDSTNDSLRNKITKHSETCSSEVLFEHYWTNIDFKNTLSDILRKIYLGKNVHPNWSLSVEKAFYPQFCKYELFNTSQTISQAFGIIQLKADFTVTVNKTSSKQSLNEHKKRILNELKSMEHLSGSHLGSVAEALAIQNMDHLIDTLSNIKSSGECNVDNLLNDVINYREFRFQGTTTLSKIFLEQLTDIRFDNPIYNKFTNHFYNN